MLPRIFLHFTRGSGMPKESTFDFFAGVYVCVRMCLDHKPCTYMCKLFFLHHFMICRFEHSHTDVSHGMAKTLI